MKEKLKRLVKKIITPARRKKIIALVHRFLVFVFSLMPIKNRVLFFTIRANGKLLDNAKAVYDALDADKVVFARMLPHSMKLKPKIYYYLLTSRVIVTDDYCRYMRSIKLREGQKLFQIWHACGAFKHFGLDAPSKLSRREEIATHSQYSAVAVTAENCRKPYAQAFGISVDRCLPIGLPRTDIILENSEKMKAEVFEKHPDLRGKTIYLFCPTFREVNASRVKYEPGIDWAELSRKMEEDEVFIIRRHPVMDYPLIDAHYPNIIDLSTDSTLALTAACSVLITDYSSVIYDACLLNVPTVFYCPDIKDYERGFYLRFPDDLPGETVTDAQELLSALREAKENPPVERIEKFRNGQMSACDGHSTERAVELIKSWLK
ncbi:MAG: CDP-glycerol glycerophosphotransferase family protein [Clostridia bacterium]|nr:CDP-glycerol glycerophosphotransferase family protein [Clostridia bacterium]